MVIKEAELVIPIGKSFHKHGAFYEIRISERVYS